MPDDAGMKNLLLAVLPLLALAALVWVVISRLEAPSNREVVTVGRFSAAETAELVDWN
jgi:hypothetical protein